MALAQFYQGLKKHHNKYCIINGIKCRIKVFEFDAIYPYKHRAIMANAEALDQDVCFDLTQLYDVTIVRNVKGGQFQL